MSVSFVPGTDQLIYNYPGQGSNLFSRYGYNIGRPRHYDYYNMLRNPTFGQSFFSDLGQLIGGLARSPIGRAGLTAATGGGAAAVGASAGTALAYKSIGSAGALPGIGVQAGSAASLPFLYDSPVSSVGSIAGYSAFEGDESNWDGDHHDHDHLDGPARAHAYHELLRHLQWQAWRDSNGIVPVYGGIAYTATVPLGLPGYQQGQQPDAPAVPATTDTIFGFPKKIVYILAAIAAAVLYFKLRK